MPAGATFGGGPEAATATRTELGVGRGRGGKGRGGAEHVDRRPDRGVGGKLGWPALDVRNSWARGARFVLPVGSAAAHTAGGGP